MSTRNFVPRADGEGSIGTAAKNWLSGYFKQLNVADVTVDASKKPTSDTTDLTTLLSNLATMIKQNKGTDDWKTAPATNLATLAALVGNLASGSDVTWKGNKFTNAKLGITGLMEKNGYICFGKNFGGLILQWVSCQFNAWVTYPIALKSVYTHSESIRCNVDDYNIYTTSINVELTRCYPHGYRGTSNGTDNIYGEIIIIGAA